MTEQMKMSEKNNSAQTIIIKDKKKSNGMGIAGFVLALIAFFFSWVPFLGGLIWLLGLIFSIIGVFKAPKGLAIAGLVISLIDLILLISAAAAFTSIF